MGYLYRPKHPPKGQTYAEAKAAGTLHESSVYWVKYYVNGKAVRESTGTEKESAAKRFLKEREGRVVTGQPILPRADRVRYEEAAQDLRQHYEATGSRDLDEFSYRVKHLDRFFGGRRIASIGQPEANAYVAHRRREGASDSTVRRELGTLTRMLRLAFKNGKLLRLPLLERPQEGAPRAGFFEREQYDAVRKHLPPDLQVATDIAYTFGWRMQSEVLQLERRHLDLDARDEEGRPVGTLRLEPGATKNGEGRIIYLTPALKAQVTAQVDRVRALERQTGRIIPYLFPHLRGPRRRGQRIRDFRKAWATACEKAGFAAITDKAGKKAVRPLFLRHDLRRTAARNSVNAGVPERVVMKLTGHKTRAMLDRYHIVSPRDLQEAARKLTGINAGITSGGTIASVLQLADSKGTGG